VTTVCSPTSSFPNDVHFVAANIVLRIISTVHNTQKYEPG